MRRILARITFLYKVKFGVSAGIIWTAELYTYVLIRQLFASQVKQELSSRFHFWEFCQIVEFTAGFTSCYFVTFLTLTMYIQSIQ